MVKALYSCFLVLPRLALEKFTLSPEELIAKWPSVGEKKTPNSSDKEAYDVRMIACMIRAHSPAGGPTS